MVQESLSSRRRRISGDLHNVQQRLSVQRNSGTDQSSSSTTAQAPNEKTQGLSSSGPSPSRFSIAERRRGNVGASPQQIGDASSGGPDEAAQKSLSNTAGGTSTRATVQKLLDTHGKRNQFPNRRFQPASPASDTKTGVVDYKTNDDKVQASDANKPTFQRYKTRSNVAADVGREVVKKEEEKDSNQTTLSQRRETCIASPGMQKLVQRRRLSLSRSTPDPSSSITAPPDSGKIAPLKDSGKEAASFKDGKTSLQMKAWNRSAMSVPQKRTPGDDDAGTVDEKKSEEDEKAVVTSNASGSYSSLRRRSLLKKNATVKSNVDNNSKSSAEVNTKVSTPDKAKRMVTSDYRRIAMLSPEAIKTQSQTLKAGVKNDTKRAKTPDIGRRTTPVEKRTSDAKSPEPSSLYTKPFLGATKRLHSDDSHGTSKEQDNRPRTPVGTRQSAQLPRSPPERVLRPYKPLGGRVKPLHGQKKAPEQAKKTGKHDNGEPGHLTKSPGNRPGRQTAQKGSFTSELLVSKRYFSPQSSRALSPAPSDVSNKSNNSGSVETPPRTKVLSRSASAPRMRAVLMQKIHKRHGIHEQNAAGTSQTKPEKNIEEKNAESTSVLETKKNGDEAASPSMNREVVPLRTRFKKMNSYQANKSRLSVSNGPSSESSSWPTEVPRTSSHNLRKKNDSTDYAARSMRLLGRASTDEGAGGNEGAREVSRLIAPRRTRSASGSLSNNETSGQSRSRSSAVTIKSEVLDRSPSRRQRSPSPARNENLQKNLQPTPHSPSSTVSGASTLLGAIQSEFLSFDGVPQDSSRRTGVRPGNAKPSKVDQVSHSHESPSAKVATPEAAECLNRAVKPEENPTSDGASESKRNSSPVRQRKLGSIHDWKAAMDFRAKGLEPSPTKPRDESSDNFGAVNISSDAKSDGNVTQHGQHLPIPNHSVEENSTSMEVQDDEQLQSTSIQENDNGSEIDDPQLDEPVDSTSSDSTEESSKRQNPDSPLDVGVDESDTMSRGSSPPNSGSLLKPDKVQQTDGFGVDADGFFRPPHVETFGWSNVSQESNMPRSSADETKEDGNWVDFSRSSWSYDSAGFVYPKGADSASGNTSLYQESEEAKRPPNSLSSDTWLVDDVLTERTAAVDTVVFSTFMSGPLSDNRTDEFVERTDNDPLSISTAKQTTMEENLVAKDDDEDCDSEMEFLQLASKKDKVEQHTIPLCDSSNKVASPTSPESLSDDLEEAHQVETELAINMPYPLQEAEQKDSAPLEEQLSVDFSHEDEMSSFKSNCSSKERPVVNDTTLKTELHCTSDEEISTLDIVESHSTLETEMSGTLQKMITVDHLAPATPKDVKNDSEEDDIYLNQQNRRTANAAVGISVSDSDDEPYDYERAKCIFDDASSIANTVSTIGHPSSLPHADAQSPRHSMMQPQSQPLLSIESAPSGSDSSRSPLHRDEMAPPDTKVESPCDQDQGHPDAIAVGRSMSGVPSTQIGIPVEKSYHHQLSVPPPPPPPPPQQARRRRSRSRSRRKKEKHQNSHKQTERVGKIRDSTIPPKTPDTATPEQQLQGVSADIPPPPPPPPAGMKKKKKKSRSSQRSHSSRGPNYKRGDTKMGKGERLLGKIDESSTVEHQVPTVALSHSTMRNIVDDPTSITSDKLITDIPSVAAGAVADVHAEQYHIRDSTTDVSSAPEITTKSDNINVLSANDSTFLETLNVNDNNSPVNADHASDYEELTSNAEGSMAEPDKGTLICQGDAEACTVSNGSEPDPSDTGLSREITGQYQDSLQQSVSSNRTAADTPSEELVLAHDPAVESSNTQESYTITDDIVSTRHIRVTGASENLSYWSSSDESEDEKDMGGPAEALPGHLFSAENMGLNVMSLGSTESGIVPRREDDVVLSQRDSGELEADIDSNVNPPVSESNGGYHAITSNPPFHNTMYFDNILAQQGELTGEEMDGVENNDGSATALAHAQENHFSSAWIPHDSSLSETMEKTNKNDSHKFPCGPTKQKGNVTVSLEVDITSTSDSEFKGEELAVESSTAVHINDEQQSASRKSSHEPLANNRVEMETDSGLNPLEATSDDMDAQAESQETSGMVDLSERPDEIEPKYDSSQCGDESPLSSEVKPSAVGDEVDIADAKSEEKEYMPTEPPCFPVIETDRNGNEDSPTLKGKEYCTADAPALVDARSSADSCGEPQPEKDALDHTAVDKLIPLSPDGAMSRITRDTMICSVESVVNKTGVQSESVVEIGAEDLRPENKSSPPCSPMNTVNLGMVTSESDIERVLSSIPTILSEEAENEDVDKLLDTITTNSSDGTSGERKVINNRDDDGFGDTSNAHHVVGKDGSGTEKLESLSSNHTASSSTALLHEPFHDARVDTTEVPSTASAIFDATCNVVPGHIPEDNRLHESTSDTGLRSQEILSVIDKNDNDRASAINSDSEVMLKNVDTESHSPSVSVAMLHGDALLDSATAVESSMGETPALSDAHRAHLCHQLSDDKDPHHHIETTPTWKSNSCLDIIKSSTQTQPLESRSNVEESLDPSTVEIEGDAISESCLDIVKSSSQTQPLESNSNIEEYLEPSTAEIVDDAISDSSIVIVKRSSQTQSLPSDPNVEENLEQSTPEVVDEASLDLVKSSSQTQSLQSNPDAEESLEPMMAEVDDVEEENNLPMQPHETNTTQTTFALSSSGLHAADAIGDIDTGNASGSYDSGVNGFHNEPGSTNLRVRHSGGSGDIDLGINHLEKEPNVETYGGSRSKGDGGELHGELLESKDETDEQQVPTISVHEEESGPQITSDTTTKAIARSDVESHSYGPVEVDIVPGEQTEPSTNDPYKNSICDKAVLATCNSETSQENHSIGSTEIEANAIGESFSSQAALSKLSAKYGSLLHGVDDESDRVNDILSGGTYQMELPTNALPMIPDPPVGTPSSSCREEYDTMKKKSSDVLIESEDQPLTPRHVSTDETASPSAMMAHVDLRENHPLGEDHLPASTSKILHDEKMAEKIDKAISVAAERFYGSPFPSLPLKEEAELPLAVSAQSPPRDSVQGKDLHFHQEEKTPRAKTRVEKTLIFPPGHPSPFEKCIGVSPRVLGTILSFLGDPAAVCKVKAVNRQCRSFVEEHMHDLIQQAVRLGGISMRMRPAFWIWVAMEQFSEASRDLRACAAEGESTELERLERKGRTGKWHQVIERDVSRSFGNLPPHKTGARLRTDSIVRALVTWGKSRTLKRGVKGTGNPPPPSRDPSQDEHDDSDSVSLAPTDTVSDWGGVTPVGSFANMSFELDAEKKGPEVVIGAKVNDEMALSGNALTEATKAILQEKLSFVLHALAAAHPEVGYCQGMDYVVAHLLRLMQETVRWGVAYKRLPGVIQLAPDVEIKPTTSDDEVAEILAKIDGSLVVEESCFRMMDIFFTAYNLGHFYWPELRCLKTCCLVFEKLIQIKLPVLADHFEHHELNVGLFALGWFQTLFLYLPSMPTATVSHMWDIWLVERSFKIFFRVATAILFLSQPILLNHELDGMMSYLNTFPDATLLSPDILIACALQIKVTNKLLMELELQVAEGASEGV